MDEPRTRLSNGVSMGNRGRDFECASCGLGYERPFLEGRLARSPWRSGEGRRLQRRPLVRSRT